MKTLATSCLLLSGALLGALGAHAQTVYEPYTITTLAPSNFKQPKDVAVDRAGNLFVLDEVRQVIYKVGLDGVQKVLAGSPNKQGSTDGKRTAARFAFPAGIAIDRSGNLYVGDQDNFTVRKVTPQGVVMTLAGLAGQRGSADGTGSEARFDTAFDTAVDGAGNVYVADDNNDTIRKITPAGVVTTLAGLAGVAGSADGTGSEARFNEPDALTADRQGFVFVADSLNDTIRQITPAGVVTTIAGVAGVAGSADGTGSAALFAGPRSIAVDADDNLYVGDDGNRTIRKITPAAVVTTLAGTPGVVGRSDGTGPDASFISPLGIAVDTSATIYVADSFNKTVRIGMPAN